MLFKKRFRKPKYMIGQTVVALREIQGFGKNDETYFHELYEVVRIYGIKQDGNTFKYICTLDKFVFDEDELMSIKEFTGLLRALGRS